MIKDLEQYRYALKEIKGLENKIARMKRNFTFSTVKGSSRQKHHQLRVITVTGHYTGGAYKRTLEILEEREADLREKTVEIEAFITSIESSESRLIIDCRYVRGLSWRKTAEEVYGHADETTPRKTLERYFKKHNPQAV